MIKRVQLKTSESTEKARGCVNIKEKRVSPSFVLNSIPIKNLSTSEQIALIQMVEVAQQRRPQIDSTVSVTPNVKNAYHKYSCLPHLKKKITIRMLTNVVAKSVLRSANSNDGAIAYKKLLESSIKSR